MDISRKQAIFLFPVYNDWESLEILLKRIKEVATNTFDVKAVVINDCSTEPLPERFAAGFPVEIVNLKVNVGHQRAIAIGLQYVQAEKTGFHYVVVMDSDGEDHPEDVVKLLGACAEENDRKIIFARRKKRQESIGFRSGYLLYKFIFRVLTGRSISFGNFSCIPALLLERIAALENIWVHYSGSIIQAMIPFKAIYLVRGKRYRGESKMNFNSLVLHGLSSVSVYFDRLSVRILIASVSGFVVCIGAVLVILYFKFFTDEAIPGWASSLILIIFTIILQLIAVTLIVLLMQLNSRKHVRAPASDIYLNFIGNKKNLYSPAP